MGNNTTTNVPGIYVDTLNNETTISINAQDERYADIVYKANNKNPKAGKAMSLRGRMDNYFKTFGEENVNFMPLVITSRISVTEKLVMDQLDKFRVRNPNLNRKAERLLGLTRDQVIEIVVKSVFNSNLQYTLAEGVTIEQYCKS